MPDTDLSPAVLTAEPCPECGTLPTAAKYLPWCSRGCQGHSKRRAAPLPPDILAKRQMYMESRESGRLRSEMRGMRTALVTAHRERDRALQLLRSERLALAYAREEIEVLRWYSAPDTVVLVDRELRRRNQPGGRRAEDTGAKHVIAALRVQS